MIEEFITFYLLFWWVMTILYKDNLAVNWLENVGNWFKQKSFLSDFFLSLARCQFCLEFHTANIGMLLYFSYCLDWRVMIWGALCASINSWARTFLNKQF